MDPVTTIDATEAGPPLSGAVVPGGETATPQAPRRPTRLIGALAGAGAGVLAIAGLFAIARLTGWSEWVGLALVVGEDGVFSPTTGVPLAWAVPSLAAAIVGAATAPAAARGVRWSGWWMGFLTYGLGILIGALLLVLVPTGVIDGSTGWPGGPLDLVVGMLTLTFVGTIIVAPLLVLCVLAGIGWAAVVHRVSPAPGGIDPGSRPIVVLGVVAAILAVLWLLVSTFLDILVAAQPV
jgi:hypothetical protein